MKIDERRLEMWDQAWEAWDDLERNYWLGRARASRNGWALVVLVLAAGEVGFGAVTWNDDSAATGLLFWIGIGVLVLAYRSVWDVQTQLDYLRMKQQNSKK